MSVENDAFNIADCSISLELEYDRTYTVTWAPSKDKDQSVYRHSLISYALCE